MHHLQRKRIFIVLDEEYVFSESGVSIIVQIQKWHSTLFWLKFNWIINCNMISIFPKKWSTMVSLTLKTFEVETTSRNRHDRQHGVVQHPPM